MNEVCFFSRIFILIIVVVFNLDGYDNFETADDFLSNKPISHNRQLQKSHRRLSKKTSFDHITNIKKDFSNDDIKEQYDDYIEDDDDHEYETADIFVENIDDDENFIDDDNANFIFKYRSSTQKSI